MARSQRPEGTKNPDGQGSFYYSEYDGYWHARVTVGVKDNGDPDRRHIKRRNEDDARDAYRELLNQVDQGLVPKQGESWTVEAWLVHWVETIAPMTARYKTVVGYKTAVYRHLIPGLGRHKLSPGRGKGRPIEPEHFEKLYRKMLAAGLKPGTVHQVHRTARTAFQVAFVRGKIFRNVVAMAQAPRVEEEEVEPFEPEDAQAIIEAALKRRNGVRFVIALALGVRQGECLGFKWPMLNRERRTLRIRKAIQRQKWLHGCDDEHACGAAYHKRAPCRQPCKRHQRPCPPPCPPDCVEHARKCPRRHGGGLVEVDVKSKAGRRTWPLPDQIFELLMRHEERQARERERAADLWEEGGWIFTQENGRPIDPRADYETWRQLLTEAGVREARLHDARHTAATVLLLLGVDPRVVMELMGWSTEAMRRRYQHVTDSIREEVASQINTYFWKGTT
ncbi:integrase/recombinase [Amycolatopsis mediterranei S699]|uniref:Integrase/recombinase n=3 Tax=Amycolatopsis mediterranei TaxID=33910 RepID=A0A0H3CV42_AMYMU|nr:site-specific integrase [Amycolatopsis mediterranei]ABX56679.1 bacteriophage-related integrase [Amycolatopsis mediterranei]ADJ42173.1 integrase/recombinase [Amycolatopsis mediterranei U32]AEK38850.1 integrase/recombinase [Amycolatopsis mediterranei S699]AFO73888.1 integrase/recombinase [Amycolatopsis mediterranei S699]AGT81017.1 integrase/recombinase [Amycolatopsis mediterranei RB]